MKKLRISPGFCAAVCLLGWLDGSLCLYFLTGVLFHEAGHLLAARLLGVRVSGISLQASGAVIETEHMDYRKELLTALAGPAASFLAALAGRYFSGGFSAVSFLLGGINLLPIYPMDGGRILRGCLLLLLPMEAALKAVRVITYVVCGGLMVAACWFAAAWQCGLWPVFAALVILWRAGEASLKP